MYAPMWPRGCAFSGCGTVCRPQDQVLSHLCSNFCRCARPRLHSLPVCKRLCASLYGGKCLRALQQGDLRRTWPIGPAPSAHRALRLQVIAVSASVDDAQVRREERLSLAPRANAHAPAAGLVRRCAGGAWLAGKRQAGGGG
eukprot:3640071-Pleurochrysis_carterae.AAC.3